MPLNEVWEVATNELYLLTLIYSVEIHAFVLMPNHIHLLITISSEDLGKIMSVFLGNLTKRINRLCAKSGHLFGGPYFWSIITSSRYFGHVLKYVYRNPIKSGLSAKVEEYEFSTASGIFGGRVLPFPIYFTKIGLEINLPNPNEPLTWIAWLNQPFPNETEKLIQKCLRKKKIHLLLAPSRRPYPELDRLI